MFRKILLPLAVLGLLVGVPACGSDPCLKLPAPTEQETAIVVSGAEVERTLAGGYECELVQHEDGHWSWAQERD
jgi:hypothetical protein